MYSLNTIFFIDWELGRIKIAREPVDCNLTIRFTASESKSSSFQDRFGYGAS